MAKENYSNIIATFKRENTDRLGKALFEMLSDEKQKIVTQIAEEKIKLSEGFSKEAGLDTANSTLFSTIVATFVEQKMRPKLLASGVIKKINMDIKGFNAIEIPIRSKLIVATDLAINNNLNYDDGVYNPVKITTGYKVASNRITWSLLQYSSVDLIANELHEIGYALARKMDSDIISAIDLACSTDNGNIKYLGTGTYVTYSDLVEGFYKLMDNNGDATHILTSPTNSMKIMNLTEIKNTWYNGIANPLQNPSEMLRPIQILLNCQFLVSNQVGAYDLYFIDSERTGYLVMGQEGVQTFDGRISGSLAIEIAGVINYGVGIIQPKSIYKLEGNAVTPTGETGTGETGGTE